MPDVPTFAESGFPQMTGTSWFALFAPSGAPPAELARIAAAMSQAALDPKVRKVVEDFGVDLPTGGVAEFDRVLAAERKRWGQAVQASGFSAEK